MKNFFLIALVAFVSSFETQKQETRWYVLELGSGKEVLSPLNEEAQKQSLTLLDSQIQNATLEAPGRAISYAGEDRGLLSFLLGIQPQESQQWLSSPQLDYKTVGLGTQIVQNQSYSRVILAPLEETRWLFVVSSAASLDQEKLRRNLSGAETRKKLIERLYNLYRDAHAARNSNQPKPVRFGYPSLLKESELEIGDPQSEANFGFKTQGGTFRTVDWLEFKSGGKRIDDGVVAKNEQSSLEFYLELRQLLSDDLFLVARTNQAGTGKVLVDGMELGEWKPQIEKGVWGEALIRIKNRLLAGKEKAHFAIQPNKGQSLSLFRLQALRIPTPEGDYLTELEAKQIAIKKGKLESTLGNEQKLFVIAGYRFLNSLRNSLNSEIVIPVDPKMRHFQCYVGLDASSPKQSEAVFRVLVNGKEKYRSRKLNTEDLPEAVFVPLLEAKELSLIIESVSPNSENSGLGIWAEPRLLR